MAKIVTVPLPHDLPENWNENQYVSPGGTEVGLTEQHGYNYLMRQVNNAQKAVQEVANYAQSKSTAGNLLLNADFRKPVNRNGKTTYTSSGITIDGWHLQTFEEEGETLTVDHGFISLNLTHADTGIRQYCPDRLEAGKTYTISCFVDDAVYSDSFVFSEGMNQVKAYEGTNYNWAVVPDSESGKPVIYPFVQYVGNINVRIYACKLETGDIQTLAHQLDDGTWQLVDPISYDLQFALTALYSPLTGEFVGYQYNNPNLLDNWYFADPVNRRNGYYAKSGATYYSNPGLTSVAGTLTGNSAVQYVNTTYGLVSVDDVDYYIPFASIAKGYPGSGNTIDRWLNNSGYNSLELTSEGVAIHVGSASSVWYTTIQNLPAGVYTLSALVYAQSGAMSLAVPGKSQNVDGNPGIVSMTFELTAFRASTMIMFGGAVGTKYIKAAKLELGSYQTLAHQDGQGNWVLNEIPNKVIETVKCNGAPTSVGGQGMIVTPADIGLSTANVLADVEVV